MSSKRRLRRKACEGKVPHATREAACTALRKVQRDRVEDGLGIYQCRHCGHWHLGHRPGSRRLFLMLARD